MQRWPRPSTTWSRWVLATHIRCGGAAAAPTPCYTGSCSRMLIGPGHAHTEVFLIFPNRRQVLRPVITGLGANFDCQIVRRLV